MTFVAHLLGRLIWQLNSDVELTELLLNSTIFPVRGCRTIKEGIVSQGNDATIGTDAIVQLEWSVEELRDLMQIECIPNLKVSSHFPKQF